MLLMLGPLLNVTDGMGVSAPEGLVSALLALGGGGRMGTATDRLVLKLLALGGGRGGRGGMGQAEAVGEQGMPRSPMLLWWPWRGAPATTNVRAKSARRM